MDRNRSRPGAARRERSDGQLRVLRSSQRGRESKDGAGERRALIPPETGTGAARERTQLGAFSGARGRAAQAPARARHSENQGAGTPAGTGEGTRSRDGAGEVAGYGGVSSLQ